jgi:hypothetical protein
MPRLTAVALAGAHLCGEREVERRPDADEPDAGNEEERSHHAAASERPSARELEGHRA